MLTSRDADEEVALKLLGDGVSLSATSLLKLKLRASVETSRARVVALTEPELQEELDSLDLEDGAAVADAGRRVRAFLEQIRHD